MDEFLLLETFRTELLPMEMLPIGERPMKNPDTGLAFNVYFPNSQISPVQAPYGCTPGGSAQL
jgi:hypothetical protein